MECKTVEGLLSAFLENELPEEQLQQIQLHLESCQECNSLKERLENVIYICDDLEEEVPFFLKNRLYLISESEEKEEDTVSLQRAMFLKWTAAMIGAAVLLLNLFYFTNIYPSANRTLHGMVTQVERIVVETGAFFERARESDSNPFLSIFRSKPARLKDEPLQFQNKEKGGNNG